MMRALIITGERDWYDYDIVAGALWYFAPDFLILGDNEGGVDAMALSWALEHNVSHKVHYNDGNWPSAGPRRNGCMIAHGVGLRSGGWQVNYVAFWSGKRKRSGTLDCMEQCVRAGFGGYVVAR